MSYTEQAKNLKELMTKVSTEHEQLINTMMMSSVSEFERTYKETTEIQMALAQLFELVSQFQAQQPS